MPATTMWQAGRGGGARGFSGAGGTSEADYVVSGI